MPRHRNDMYNHPSNSIRKILRLFGAGIYRLGLAPKVIALRKKKTRVLLYHAVEEHSSPYTDALGVSVSPAMFEANLKYINDHYNVVPVDDLGKSPAPDNALAITFDDGYRSVYEHAYPLLRKYRMPACVYLITCAVENRLVWVNELNWALLKHPKESLAICHQFPDLLGLESRPDIIDRVKTDFSPANIRELCKRLQKALEIEADHQLYASPDELQEMRKSGITLGFHTRDHYNLANCDKHELSRQLDDSGLEDLLDPGSFAYPFGSFDCASVEELRDGAYQSIMTVGNNNDRFSSYHVDRVEVFSADPAVVFARLEVEEPIIAAVRKVKLNLKSTHRWLMDACFPGT